MKNDVKNHNKPIQGKDFDEWVEEKAKELLDTTSDKDFSYSVRLGNAEEFIRQIINDQKVRVSKKRIIEIENLLIDVANGNTGVILASARIQGWLMEAGVEMENK